ncbi:NAD(P)H-binding protein [Streptomyces hainanensis]|uniref:NAD-dependent epimerase/dehydratase family protein n=1 Tax=Streptomyces hainanensis TaxID=402648 RepID=A0A4R4T9V8_9ACTN|nr:NAD(P)H-binding protein [Streptomyces hainanensis]TDC74041.1 NAD-dependent epimerase/dehydratase family protein [Streptomyces hainanensis]
MILVTGATGTIGSHVARLLTERGVPFRAMSRRRRPGGVRADFDDPASLARAVADVDAVFLVTVPPVPSAEHDIALIAAARAAGVRRIVKLSAIGSGERFEGTTVGAWHVAAEEAIEASGLGWTMLRPPSFASNLLWHRALIRAGEPVPNLAGDSRQAVVDPRDVAAVAVAALTDGAHEGRRYDLTGPTPLTFADQVAILGGVLGRRIGIADVDGLDRLPAGVATGVRWARSGAAAYVTDHVPRVLGRPAGTFERWARDHREAFTAPG